MPETENDTVIINGRTYPSNYTPGQHWALDKAWHILDGVKEGVIPMHIRAFLAGAITAVLMEDRESGGDKGG